MASFLSLGGATAAKIAVKLSVTICVGDVSTLASTNAKQQRELVAAAVRAQGRGQVAEEEEGSIKRIVLSTSWWRSSKRRRFCIRCSDSTQS